MQSTKIDPTLVGSTNRLSAPLGGSRKTTPLDPQNGNN